MKMQLTEREKNNMEIKSKLADFKNTYWNYYLQLENDFFETAPYCSINEKNNDSFSVKYLQLYLSICSEIDIICKSLCKELDDSLKERCGIKDYIRILKSSYPTFSGEIVSFLSYKYPAIQPWEDIDKDSIPSWWDVYNDVKHHRDQIKKNTNKANYEYANQENIIKALSALYVLIRYWTAKTFDTYIKENYNIMPLLESKALKLTNWTFYSGFGGQSFDPNKFFKYIENDGVENE